MKNKKDEAVECFDGGYNCAQAIFSTYSPMSGLEKNTALRIACGFGGGMGRMQETCGAVTGAFMLIGLKYGKCRKDDEVAKEKTYSLVREFSDRFTEKHSSIKCREIIDCDISTPEGRELYDNRNLSEKCTECIRDAASIVEDILKS